MTSRQGCQSNLMGSILIGEGKPGVPAAPGGRLFGVVPREGVFRPEEGSGAASGFFAWAGGGKPMSRATV